MNFSYVWSQKNVSVENNLKQGDIECCLQAQLFINQKTSFQRQTMDTTLC